MGYAVEMALTCDSCGRELDRRFSSRKMATDPNITRQPFHANRRAVLAAKEGGFCQTGLSRVTAIMNMRGGLHHKMFAAIATRIQRQLYGVAADTLAESRHTIHRVHAQMYGPCRPATPGHQLRWDMEAWLPVPIRSRLRHRLRCAVEVLR